MESPHFEYPFKIYEGLPYSDNLKLDLCLPDPLPDTPLPVILNIHGGGWQYGHRWLGRSLMFALFDFAYVSFDFRSSTEAIFPAKIKDCKTAVRWVRAHAEQYQFDPHRIGVWGISSGGHLAALLGVSDHVRQWETEQWGGYSSSVQAVVDISGPTDLLQADWAWAHQLGEAVAQLLGGLPSEQKELASLASPMSHISSDTKSTFCIIHGERDEIIPIQQSEKLHEALRATGVKSQFIRIPEGDHMLEAAWDDLWQIMLNFFRSKLTPERYSFNHR